MSRSGLAQNPKQPQRLVQDGILAFDRGSERSHEGTFHSSLALAIHFRRDVACYVQLLEVPYTNAVDRIASIHVVLNSTRGPSTAVELAVFKSIRQTVST